MPGPWAEAAHEESAQDTGLTADEDGAEHFTASWTNKEIIFGVCVLCLCTHCVCVCTHCAGVCACVCVCVCVCMCVHVCVVECMSYVPL